MNNADIFCIDNDADTFKSNVSYPCLEESSNILACPDIIAQTATSKATFCFCLGGDCSTSQVSKYNVSIPTYLITNTRSFTVYGPPSTNDHSIRAGSTGNAIVIRSPSGLYSTDLIGVFTKTCSPTVTTNDVLFLLQSDAYSQTASITNLLSVYQPFNAPLQPTPANGGNPFICLCRPATNGCTSPGDYVVLVGSLVVTGALAAEQTVLYLGGSSVVKVTGRGLTLDDRIMLTDADTCGSTAGSSSFTTAVLSPTRLAADGTASEYADLVLQAGVGLTMRVCWCGRLSVTCTTCCSSESNFTVDLGDQVEIVGPIGNLIMYEDVGTAFDVALQPVVTSHPVFRSGDRLSIVQGLVCGDMYAMRASHGVSLAPTSQLTGTWTGVVLGTDGKYAICYCSSLTQDYCELDGTDFVQVGLIMASGGLSLSTADLLIAGAPMAIDVIAPGDRFTPSTRIRVVESNEAYCGRSTASLNSEFVDDSAAVLATTNGISVASVTDGTTARRFAPVRVLASGAYRVCVCLSGTCNQDRNFTVDAGILSLSGATADQTWTCGTGSGCTVTLTVDNASAVFQYGAGSVQLVYGTTCGSAMLAVPTAVFTSGTRQTQASGVNVNSGTAFFSFGVTQSGYTYSLCWCPAFSADGICTDTSQFSVLAGTLTVVGITLPATSHVCGMRANCLVEIEGRGLSVSDAILLLPSSSTAACGAVGISLTTGFHDGSFSNEDYQRGGFFSVGGGSAVYYRAVSSPRPNVVQFAVGSPLLIPTVDYRVCYCRTGRGVSCTDSPTAYADTAGRVAVRGALFPATQPVFACDQNRNCSVTIPFLTPSSAQDRVRLFSTTRVCGLDSPVADFDPEGRPLNDQLSTTFVIPFVPYSGAFQLCYCPALPENSVTTCTATAWKGSPSGTVSISGALLGLTTLATSPSLPSVVSLAANIAAANPGFFRLVCAVRVQPFPQAFPTRAEIRNCADCVGAAVSPYFVLFGTINQLHIPLSAIPPNTSSVSAYCFVDQNCETESVCGVSLPVTVALVTNFSPAPLALTVTATIPFLLEPPTIAAQDPTTVRVKIVAGNLACTDTAPNLGGLVNGPVCDSTFSCRSGSPFWPNVMSVRGGLTARICTCDRLTPMSLCQSGFWRDAGSLQVVGPLYTNSDVQLPRGFANPDTTNVRLVTVAGGRVADAFVLVSEGACGSLNGMQVSEWFVEVTHEATDSGGSSIVLKTGRVPQNAPVNTIYDVCWCPWETGCNASAQFGTVVGKVTIQTKVDCEMSDWFVDVVCNKTCGSGVQTLKRIIRVSPQGGGQACPAVTVMTQVCNSQACPAAEFTALTLTPAVPAPTQPFVLTIEGWNLQPDVDRVLLISTSRACGGAATVDNFGGAACWYGVTDNTKLNCGDGVFSLKVDQPQSLRLCFCDASFIFDTGLVANRVDACSLVSHYTRELLVFSVGSDASGSQSFPLTLLLGSLGAVAFLGLVVSVVWVKLKRRRLVQAAPKEGDEPYSEALVLHVSQPSQVKQTTFPTEYTLEDAEEGSPDPSEPDYWQAQDQAEAQAQPQPQLQFAQLPLAYGPVDDEQIWPPEEPSDEEIAPTQKEQPPTPRFPEPEKEIRPNFLARFFGTATTKVKPIIEPPGVSYLGDSPPTPLSNRSDLSMSSPNIRPPATLAPAGKVEEGERTLHSIAETNELAPPALSLPPARSPDKEFEPVRFDEWKIVAEEDEVDAPTEHEPIPPTPLNASATSVAIPPLSPSNAAAEEPLTVSFPPRVARPLDALAQELAGDDEQPKSGSSTPRVSLSGSARRNRLLNMK